MCFKNIINKQICLSIIFILIFINTSFLEKVEAINKVQYDKYTTKSYWDKNDNNGEFGSKYIPSYPSFKRIYNDSKSELRSRYLKYPQALSYKIVEDKEVNGIMTYKFEGTNKKLLELGDIFYTIDNDVYAPRYKLIDTKENSLGERYLVGRMIYVDAIIKEYIYEHKGKGDFIETVESPEGTYPNDGYKDGYWYVKSKPKITILNPHNGDQFQGSKKPTFEIKVTNMIGIKTIECQYFKNNVWKNVTSSNFDVSSINNFTLEDFYDDLPYFEDLKFRFKIDSYLSNEVSIQKSPNSTIKILSPIDNQKIENGNLKMEWEIRSIK